MAAMEKHRQSIGVPRKKAVESNTAVKSTALKLWIIKIISGRVIVEGYRAVSDNDATTLQNWRSTPIAFRINAKTVETISGSIYTLKGGIDEDEAAEAGIPEELIEEFAGGFPENWEKLIREHFPQVVSVGRRHSIHTATTNNSTMDEEEGKGANGVNGVKNGVLQVDDTMDAGETSEDDDRLKEAKKRRSIQKGRKSMMNRVQPATPIEEEEEEEEKKEKTPARRKTPGRGAKNGETPVTRKEEKKTPGRGRGKEKTERNDDQEMDEMEEPLPAAAAALTTRTPRGRVSEGKKTPKGGQKKERDEGKNTHESTLGLSVVAIGQRKEEKRESQRRVSLDEIPREIMEKAIPLKLWVIRFVRGGTPSSIFPHFQFKCCGFRPECSDSEWTTSAIQKVVPPYIMFTSSSIYRLDGPLDVDQATTMGFPPSFITDFLMGFPDDWEERLETFFNKTFGPPPQPRIVEVMSDGGTADDGKMEEEKKMKKHFDTPRTSDGEEIRVKGLKMHFHQEMPKENRKRKEPIPSSSSDSQEESESDEEEILRREARRVEKEMRREEKKAQREAELRMKAKEVKKKRFEVKVNRTPDGVPVSRSGRTLRTPMATWAGESITYDVHGNAVEMRGVTTTTKMTVGKTNMNENDRLAAHYGIDSPLNTSIQKERAIAPPAASLPKTPAPRKSKAENRGYSDDETDQKMFFDHYMSMLASQAEATPAFILKKGKRRLRVVESSDSEAEAEVRRKEKKRREKEERRRLKESEEEDGSSDEVWKRKKKVTSKKKTVTVKKEKQVKRAPSKKRKTRKEESEEEEDEEGESEVEIEHDEDAVTFVLSDEGSNARGNGYSDDDLVMSEEEEEEVKRKKNKKEKKPAVKRGKAWKEEELKRLKLAIQAADPSSTAGGWEIVAKSLGGERTAEECIKVACERLKMKVDDPTEQSDEGECGSERSGIASEDDEKMNRRKARMDDENRLKGVTAKKGTVTYAIETENKKREMMMGGTSSQDDFYQARKERLSVVDAPLPSVAVFDADDSLLECFDDPEAPEAPKQRNTKTAMMAAAPSTPHLSAVDSYENSPVDSLRRSARRSSTKFVPSPVVNQNDLTRYVHQLSRSKNVSMLSKSMADKSRMMPPALHRGRITAKATEAMGKVDRMKDSVRNRRRPDDGDNILEEDEENDNMILAGI